jgi:MarR family transcriptional regulator, temperature-dependent positive regulator of motility
VAQDEGMTQTDIVQRSGIDRSTTTDVVKRLLRKGHIERRRMPQDARAYAVRLSKSGRDLLTAAAPLAAEVDEMILAHLSQDARQRFLAALAVLADRVDVHLDARYPAKDPSAEG